MTTQITPDSLTLLLALAEDAPNWSGTPLIDLNPSERGNLTQLKKAGLLGTSAPEDDGCVFAYFTDEGIEFLAGHGVDLGWVKS